MKLSNYNFLKNYDGVNVFFNAKTCALVGFNGLELTGMNHGYGRCEQGSQ